MAKAIDNQTLVVPAIYETTYTLTLNRDEAQALADALAMTSKDGIFSSIRLVDGIASALRTVGINHKDRWINFKR